VAFRETVERLARNEFLGNPPFEFDAMGTVLGHAVLGGATQRYVSIVPNAVANRTAIA
jgi:hypothetical protein